MKEATTAQRLKQIMKERGLKQIDILEACKPYCEKYGVKLAKNDLSQYISGKVKPGQDKLSILGLALNVNEVWLMGYNVPSSKYEPDSPTKGIKIPVLGYVRAGVPISAVENILDWEEISSAMASQGEFFALSIKGDSMEPKISEGDIVIVRQQTSVDDGELAVVLINGNDATVKKFYKTDNGIKLISTNPKYDPFFFTPEEVDSLPVQVIGKVVELRAKF